MTEANFKSSNPLEQLQPKKAKVINAVTLLSYLPLLLGICLNLHPSTWGHCQEIAGLQRQETHDKHQCEIPDSPLQTTRKQGLKLINIAQLTPRICHSLTYVRQIQGAENGICDCVQKHIPCKRFMKTRVGSYVFYHILLIQKPGLQCGFQCSPAQERTLLVISLSVSKLRETRKCLTVYYTSAPHHCSYPHRCCYCPLHHCPGSPHRR